MTGWQREIIDPVEALIAPRTLVWKEKWGQIRVEWIRNPDGDILPCGGVDTIIEEASKLCCADCGRWNGWLRRDDDGPAEVTTAAVRGWYVTLCQWCREKANAQADHVAPTRSDGA
jgi:hypothetical protein